MLAVPRLHCPYLPPWGPLLICYVINHVILQPVTGHRKMKNVIELRLDVLKRSYIHVYAQCCVYSS